MKSANTRKVHFVERTDGVSKYVFFIFYIYIYPF